MGWLERMAARVGVRRDPVLHRTSRVTSCDSGLTVESGIDFDRTPPRHWLEAVEAMAPLSDHMAGLTLAWEAGDRWQPIHRWMLWQLQPWAYVPAVVKEELQGPHPRTGARLTYVGQTVNGVTEMRPRVVGGPCRFVDRRTWELHQQFAARGVLVRPIRFWVLQGAHGGHPFMVTPEEQRLRGAQGLPADVPSAGDLPYAGFDARVAEEIRRYDLWQYAHGGTPKTAAVKAAIARMSAQEREANALQWKQWQAFGAQHADEFQHAFRRDGLHLHRWTKPGERPRATDVDRRRDAYLNDTTMEAVA